MMLQPRPRGKHFTPDERTKIEALYKAGLTHQAIADVIGCCRSAITRELKRGMVDQLQHQTWLIRKTYDAYYAQQAANYQKSAHSKGLKLDKNYAYANAISACICSGYSPYAAIKVIGNAYGLVVSKQTMYRYIQEGLIPDVTYVKLPVGHPKKRKSKIKYVMSTANILHRSIERRALSVLSRQSFGHWEEDSIIGKRTGKKESCLVLTERATRQEIVIKVCDKTPQCTTKAMQELKHNLGKDFTKIFKTLTVDNGVEFTNQQGFDDLGLTVFYCHPHAPYERASNENNNKLLRRHFPKGQSMKDKTQEDATRAQHFINNYPREMFHGKCSNDLFKEQLEKLNLDDPDRVYKFFNLN